MPPAPYPIKGGFKKTRHRRKLRRSCRTTKKRRGIIRKRIIRKGIMKTRRRVMKNTKRKNRNKHMGKRSKRRRFPVRKSTFKKIYF